MYVIYCVDKPDHAHVRAENRPAHIEHLKAHAEKAVCIGPTLTDDGEGMNGSVIVMNFENRAEAQAFAEADPYAKAGLFESVTIKRFKKVMPA